MFENINYFNTIISSGNDDKAIEKASEILRQGGLVAFPTETVYGLGADALNEDASAKIYAAKGRPSDNPLIVHIADTKAVYELAESVPEKAVMLMEAFWPGPLTIILNKKKIVPDGTTGGLDTVAILMPSHPVAMKLIKESGVYIAAPSANTSGRPSPTLAEHVIEDMNGRIDMILDGGAVGIGIESTIVDLTGETPTILRPGYITKKMLEEIIGDVLIDRAIIEPDPNLRPKAPGMKYTHYAPKGEVTIVESEMSDVKEDHNLSVIDIKPESIKDDEIRPIDKKIIDKINALVTEKNAQGFKTAVIATKDNAPYYNCDNVLIVGEADKGVTISANLYAILRKCDTIGAEYIYSEALNQNELGGAIMNRLLKAAGHRVIKVH
ncbi:MAG: threonylcarbamoyl-AMP synthase [Lachnospiraceae bacterium]|nr:threonylcarbamoyl-AMP synthase [Lachnospiraceae bacterium]